MTGWRYEGEVTHERCHANVFLLSLFLLQLTFAPRTKTSNRPQAGGRGKREKKREKKRTPKKRKPHTHTSGGPRCSRGRQAFNTITTHAIVAGSKALVWLKSAAPTPGNTSGPLSHCPPAPSHQPFSASPHASLSFTVLMTRHKRRRIHSPCRARIITLRPTTATQTKLPRVQRARERKGERGDMLGRGRAGSDVDLHEWSQRRKQSGAQRQMERFLSSLLGFISRVQWVRGFRKKNRGEAQTQHRQVCHLNIEPL